MDSIVGKNNLSAFINKPTPEPTPEPTPKVETPKVVAEKTPIETPQPTTQNQPTPAEPTAETPKAAETVETKDIVSENTENTTIPEPTPTTPTPAVDEEALKAFVKDKYGKEVTSLEDLFKEPEQVADPLEGLSDEAKQFLKFNKETGRDYNEYQALNRDIDALSPLDIAREKAITQSGGALSINDVDAYLEKKLNIDLSDTKNLEKFDQIELNSFAGDYKNELLENKKKYATPLEKQIADKDFVTLENGTQMRKADYDAAVAQRNQYLADIQKASDKITASTYEVKIDDNGIEKVIPLSYEYSKQDVLDMAANASDIDNAISKLFSTAEGAIDHAKLQEGLHWADASKRGKAINAIVHKALAKQAEEFMAKEHNVKVPTKQMPSSKTSRTVPLPGQQKSNNSGYLQHFINK